MKNTKKALLSLSTLALALSLAACEPASSKGSDPASVSSTEATVTGDSDSSDSLIPSASENSDADNAKESKDPDAIDASPAVVQDEEETDFSQLAESLVNFPYGTAGSSLKIIQIANDMIPYGPQLQTAPEAFVMAYREKSDEEPAMAKEIFMGLGQTMQDLVTGDSNRLGEAESAGVRVNESKLTAEEWEAVFTKMVEQFDEESAE